MNAYQKPDSWSTGIAIEDLELIADWKDDLRARLARARLQFELVGGNTETIIALESEVSDFKRVCKTLKAVTHA